MKRPSLVPAAALTLLLLTGCTPTPPAPLPKVNTMTREEAVAVIIRLADAAGEQIGKGWKPEGPLTPWSNDWPGDDCTLPNGQHGVNFTIVWRGPGVADVDAVAAKIQAAWTKLGTDVPVVTQNSMSAVGEGRVLADPPYLTGTYPDGYGVELIIGTRQTVLNAITHCVPDPTEPSAE